MFYLKGKSCFFSRLLELRPLLQRSFVSFMSTTSMPKFDCCAVLCCAVLCCAVLCCAVLCCAVLCCAVLCCAVLSVMVLQAMRVLKPGGLLMTCSCSGAVTLDDHFMPALRVRQLQKQALQTVNVHRYCTMSAADDIVPLSLSCSAHTPCPSGCSFVSHYLSGLLWLHAGYKQRVYL